jgi:AcrR family transcriptional regulator
MNVLNDNRSKRKFKDRAVDAKSEKILEAAERLFLLNGMRGTTMEAIAREAGVAKPTLYGRFPDKDAVFSAVVAARFAKLKAEFSGALAGDGSAPERVARALSAKYGALYALFAGSPHAAEILAAAESLPYGEKSALYDWTVAEVTACLEAAGLPDAGHRAALVVSASEGLRLRAGGMDRLAADVRFLAERLLA